MKSYRVFKSAIAIIVFSTSLAEAQVLQGTGPYNGGPGFDRGFQSTQHCGNDPESWVRGSASLDKPTGVLNIQVQVETDDLKAGPKGRVFVAVRDANGQDLANVETDEFGRGGKPPGAFVASTFNKATNLTSKVSKMAASMYVVAQCTGKSDQLFGVGADEVLKAIKVIITPLGKD